MFLESFGKHVESRNERTGTGGDFTVHVRTIRSRHRRCCIKKLLSKVFQYPQEAPVLESIFKNVADLQTCNFIKKRPQHRCFPVNIVEFLILPVLKNICKPLLFNFLDGSLLHEPKGLRPKLYDGLRLQGPSHKSNFLFKLLYVVLNQVPTCIRKLWTNKQNKSNTLVVFDGLTSIQVIVTSFQVVLGRFRSFQIALGRFSSFLTLVSTYFFVFCET